MTEKQRLIGEKLRHQLASLETDAFRFGFHDTEKAIEAAKAALSKELTRDFGKIP